MYFVGLICRAPGEEPRGTEEKVKFFTSYVDQKKKKKDDELVSNSRRRNHLRNEILVITYLRGEQILLTLRRKNENSQEN